MILRCRACGYHTTALEAELRVFNTNRCHCGGEPSNKTRRTTMAKTGNIKVTVTGLEDLKPASPELLATIAAEAGSPSKSERLEDWQKMLARLISLTRDLDPNSRNDATRHLALAVTHMEDAALRLAAAQRAYDAAE